MSGLFRIRALAARDIERQAAHIAARNRAAGLRFPSAVQKTLQQLADNPLVAGKSEFETAHFPDLRVWPVRGFENWLVYFSPTEDGIEVHRVLHGAQDGSAAFSAN